MIASIKTIALFGLSGLAYAYPKEAAAPEFRADGGIILQHKATDYFPHAIGDIGGWDVSTRFTGFNSSMESWLTSLDPHSVKSDEAKAEILISAAYAKPFNAKDYDMVADKEALLGAVAGEHPDKVAQRIEARFSQYIISKSHVVLWHACSSFFSCISGTTCQFSIDVGKAPRSQCQNQGGQTCCISWSTYKVQAGFFSRTWTNCNSEVNNDHLDKASCEGKADNTGGDVCLSNRASGCS